MKAGNFAVRGGRGFLLDYAMAIGVEPGKLPLWVPGTFRSSHNYLDDKGGINRLALGNAFAEDIFGYGVGLIEQMGISHGYLSQCCVLDFNGQFYFDSAKILAVFDMPQITTSTPFRQLHPDEQEMILKMIGPAITRPTAQEIVDTYARIYESDLTFHY